MKRRRRLFIGLIVITALATWRLFPRELVYDGRTTSQWLTMLESGTDADRAIAVVALQHIGEEAAKETAALVDHPTAAVRSAAFDVLARS
jgi:hypothetical protein